MPIFILVKRAIAILGFLLVLLCWATAAIGKRCGVCQREIRDRIYLFSGDYVPEKIPICAECAQSEKTCAVCMIPIRGKHLKLSDERLLCERDAKECVLTDEALQVIFTDVKRDLFKMLAGSGSLPDRNLTVQLAGRNDLDRLARAQRFPHDKHLTMGLTQTRMKGQDAMEHRIFVLQGLRPARVAAICAHEYTHAWMHQNVPAGRYLATDTVEGFCELVAFKLMTERNETIEKKIILSNSYTSGQISTLIKAEDRYRFHEILQWIKTGIDLQINQENTARLLVRKEDEVMPVSWQPTKRTAVPDTLVLRGISGTAQRRFALVNDATLAKDEQAKVRVGATNVLVRCLEITDSKVVLSVNGSSELTELTLRQ